MPVRNSEAVIKERHSGLFWWLSRRRETNVKSWLLVGITGFWFMLCSAHANHGEAPSVHDFFKETFTTREGLPHNTVNDITQTADGYLWFATWEGAARFNGREFQIFDRSPITGLPDSGIRALDASESVGLAVAGARGGFALHHQYDWQAIGPLPTIINQALITSDDSVWLATEGSGVYRYHPQQGLQQYNTVKNGDTADALQALAEIPGVGVVAGGTHGLFILSQNQLNQGVEASFEPISGSAALDNIRVLSLLWEATDQQLLIGTEAGLYRWQAGAITTVDPRLDDLRVSQILRASDGSLWLGTLDRGLFRLGEHGLEHLNAPKDLPNSRVVALYEDRERSIWVGTNGGLVRLREAPFQTITRDDGLSDNFIRTLLPLGEQTIMVGTSVGLSTIEAEQVRPYQGPRELRTPSVLSLAKTDAHLWVGTYASGIFRTELSTGAVTDQSRANVLHVTQAEGLPVNEIRAILPRPNGDVWVGTAQGLARLKFTPTGQLRDIETFTHADGLPGNFLIALTATPDGRIWIGTGDGAAVMTAVDTDTPVITPLALRQLDGAAYTFGFHYQASANTLWLATDRGLVHYPLSANDADAEVPAPSIIGRAQGLPFDKYFAVTIDNLDHIWLSSNRGLVRFELSAALEVVNNQREQVVPDIFGEADGMLSSQANGGSSPTIAQTADGRVWFATATGVATVQPERLVSAVQSAPPVVIEGFEADGRSLPLTNTQALAAATNRVTIRYAGLGYVMPQRVRYFTMLEDFDEDWVARGNLTTAEYTNLPPGNYVFKVRAFYPGTEEISAEAQLNFHITPAVYHYKSFWFALLLAALLLVWLALRYREGRLRITERKLRELVAEKTQELARQAREDQLTRLANRRAFDEQLEREFERAERYQKPLCLAIIDIDFFKRINDDYSHAQGDLALQLIAKELQLAARQVDFLARWGGEEFVILLPETTLEEAVLACERIRSHIAKADFSTVAADLKLTVSIGLAGNEQIDSRDKLIQRADEALYLAKRAGRNCLRTA